MFTVTEGEEREVQPADEGYKLPKFDQIRYVDSWVHLNPAIQKVQLASSYQQNGRLTLILSPDLDAEKNPDDEMKLLEAEDPYQPRLKSINLDRFEGRKAWQIRVVGDQTDYNPLSKNQTDKVNYGVVVIKSLVWPGLTTVACVIALNSFLEQIIVIFVRRLRFQVK